MKLAPNKRPVLKLRRYRTLIYFDLEIIILGYVYYKYKYVISTGIANGSLTQDRLDDMAIRNVIGYYYVGLDNEKQPSAAGTTEYRNVRGDHSKLIRRSAGEPIVLLKNTNNTLPLNKPLTMSIYGAHAGPAIAGPNQAFSVQGTSSDTYQSHLATSGGSGQASFPYLMTPHTALIMRAAEDGTMLWWVLNNTYTATSSSGGGMGGGQGGGNFTGGPGGHNSTTGGDMGGATANSTGGVAAGGMNLGNPGSGTSVSPSIENYASDGSEVCIVFINANSGEGGDRSELANTEQDQLVNTVADNCNNTVIVVNTVGPRILESWISHTNVTAVLYAGMLGQESGNAIADVLYGDVNQSSKLSYTIAKSASDYLATVCETAECDFTEGVYLDYRYFEKNNLTARFPFGHALSDSTFEYSNITVHSQNTSSLSTNKYATGTLIPGGPADLFEEVLSISIVVRNSGSVAGAEVAQLYISSPEEAQQPVKVLRGFKKSKVLGAG
ncbi:glycosyl hydrolase family 3 C-terminal domain-containing protein [Lophiotrema nucula]|uniref:beta-glucosidase n=1 Tax=Lophiotrema nucula TaxID=690887 RepID=A0A6A5ZL33_9PLEO|nr:glycosyl hydrolase family 3 C-terminal domain-containing protein [Lophiotrema nucula]